MALSEPSLGKYVTWVITKTKKGNKGHRGQMECLESRRDLLPLAEDLFTNLLFYNTEHTGKWIKGLPSN